MKGLENQTYLFALIAFNLLSLIFLLFSIRWPGIARLLFFLLFSWACWMNWTTSQQNPAAYLEYADLTFSHYYRNFIYGWFSKHIPLMVGFIAASQGLIALTMLLKGWIFKLGCIGGIIFMLAIAPLGVGAGFPCSIIFSIALAVLIRKGKDYLWSRETKAIRLHEMKNV
ncbi:MAG: hypothetical protein ACXWWC_07415 [Chitinophagaceae bacterium]